jgi:hypothetical protein
MPRKAKRLFVGDLLSSEVFNPDWPEHLQSSRERIIHSGSPEFGSANFATIAGPAVSVTWPSANKPMAIPFRVFKGMTVYQLGWRNGSGTMTDSADIGIYDTAWNRKVSAGSTARSGASAIQWIDVTDTFLRPAKYYIVTATNGVTASQQTAIAGALTVGTMAALGCFDSATNAFVLPDPLTNMVAAATFTWAPTSFIAARVPF